MRISTIIFFSFILFISSLKINNFRFKKNCPCEKCDFKSSIDEEDFHRLRNSKHDFYYVKIWASWCKPCLADFRFFNALSDSIQTHNLNIGLVTLSVDENKEAWLHSISRFISPKVSYNFIVENAHESCFLTENINLKEIPRYILMDQNGKILDSFAKDPSNPELLKVLKKINQ